MSIEGDALFALINGAVITTASLFKNNTNQQVAKRPKQILFYCFPILPFPDVNPSMRIDPNERRQQKSGQNR